jgi:diaminopimelate epimerase
MCGNGGRCAVAFAFANGMAGERCSFNAYDGLHQGIIHHAADFSTPYDVSITMGDVERIEQGDNFYFLDTGSPHYVEFVKKVAEIDVVMEGRKTRNSYRFAPDGTNVNFVEVSEDRIFVRTYERGVEDETLSCGTGVTAAAIAAYIETGKKDFKIHTTGGDFRVSFEDEGGTFTSLWLRGPAEMVFRGDFEL